MTAIELCNVAIAPEIGEEIRQQACQLDSVQTGVGIKPTFSTHYVGNNGRNGLRNLIVEILTEAGGRGLSSRQILRAGKAKFPTAGRYPYTSFCHYLANVLAKTGEVRPVAVSRTGERGRPGFVWVLGPAATVAK